MKLSTLTAEQDALRTLVMRQITEQGVTAGIALQQELDDGASREDVAAVAEDLCPGAGRDYR